MGVKLGFSQRMKNIGWKVFENRVLRKIFGMRGEVKRRRKLRNGEPHDLYCTPDIMGSPMICTALQILWGGP
jgi:hypothetical protein